ncbi:MAG: carboxylate--amine ligase [Sulfurimonas sp.]|nr:carboxylate--amine ligase [Sulfurimonas sp.]
MYTQETRQVNFGLNHSEPVNFTLLDEWLQVALKIDIEDEDTALNPVESLVRRKLLFIRSMLQAVLLPCFDAGEIINIEKDLKTASKWNIKVNIVNIENISELGYKTIINFVFKTIYWMMKNPISDENIKYLHELIQKEVINKLKGIGNSGKSTMPILLVAHKLHIPFFHLGGGTYQLGCGAKSRQISRSTTDLDSSIGAKMSNNKMLTSNLIRMAGLPAPTNGVAVTIQNAISIANKIGWPIVVKPVDADRGEGVSVGVKNTKQLKIAFKEALRFSRLKNIIIEREVKGIAHRIFIVNSKLLYAIKRLPKSIQGDGKKQVSVLIEEANKLLLSEPPWLRNKLFPNDSEAIQAIKKSGFSLASIPKVGELVALRTIESTASGGTPQNVTDFIHQDNIDISLRAAKLFGLEIAGIDIITIDIKKPWYETGAIINEVNLAPLLGGGEISKSYIPEFLERIVDGDGRIPINVVIGGSEAMDIAIKEQNNLIKKGVACFLTSHKVTINDSASEMILPFKGLYKRCKALLLNHQVQAVILVIQTDELISTGLPIDGINQITNTGGKLVSSKNIDKELSQDRFDALLSLIDS